MATKRPTIILRPRRKSKEDKRPTVKLIPRVYMKGNPRRKKLV